MADENKETFTESLIRTAKELADPKNARKEALEKFGKLKELVSPFIGKEVQQIALTPEQANYETIDDPQGMTSRTLQETWETEIHGQPVMVDRRFGYGGGSSIGTGQSWLRTESGPYMNIHVTTKEGGVGVYQQKIYLGGEDENVVLITEMSPEGQRLTQAEFTPEIMKYLGGREYPIARLTDIKNGKSRVDNFRVQEPEGLVATFRMNTPGKTDLPKLS